MRLFLELGNVDCEEYACAYIGLESSDVGIVLLEKYCFLNARRACFMVVGKKKFHRVEDAFMLCWI